MWNDPKKVWNGWYRGIFNLNQCKCLQNYIILNLTAIYNKDKMFKITYSYVWQWNVSKVKLCSMFCFVYWEENLFGIYGLHYWINYNKVKQCSMFCFVWMKEKVSSYIWLEFFEWNILEYIWVYE